MLAAMSDVAFDPDAPLPGPPDPWASTGMPSPRPGPPYHMTEMIEAEPGLARRLLSSLAAPSSPAAGLAAAISEAAVAGQTILVTGCGTSEHASLAGVELLREALRTAGLPTAALGSVQALELSLDPMSSGLVIGVTHEGATPATNAALAHSFGKTAELETMQPQEISITPKKGLPEQPEGLSIRRLIARIRLRRRTGARSLH